MTTTNNTLNLDKFETVMMYHFLLRKKERFSNVAINYLTPEMIGRTNSFFRPIFSIIKSYYESYDNFPTASEIVLKLNNEDEDAFLAKTLAELKKIPKGEIFNFDELLKNLEVYIKQRSIQKILDKQIELKTSNGVYDTHQIQKEMDRVFGISLKEDTGFFYLENIEKHIDELKRVDNFISSGFPSLDKALGGGFCSSDVSFYVFGGTVNIGKAQPLYTQTPTPYKGIVAFGSLQPGDCVFGSDGSPVTITHVHPQGIVETYEITFWDGRKVKACKDHLWNVWNKDLEIYETLTTLNILHKFNSSKDLIKIPCSSPIFTYSKPEIPPYVLGCFLTSGAILDDKIVFHLKDKNIVSQINGIFQDKYYLNTILPPENKTVYNLKEYKEDHYVLSDSEDKNDFYLDKFKKIFVENNKIYSKYVPVECIDYTAVDKINLLKGILDTKDDLFLKENTKNLIFCINKNLFDLKWNHDWLFKQIQKIIWSLGCSCKLYSASKTYLEILVSKKIYEELKNDYVIEKFGDNFVISIKKTADEESMCITVNAKDNLYLTTNYIVTHNSLTMANLATNCLKQNKKVQVATFELSEKNWAKRVSSIITGIELSNLHYKSDELRKEIETLKSSLEKGRLNIKQFPANEITPRQYSSFLKQLKRVDGFVPDIIILDMHSLMIPNSGNQSKGYNMYKDQKDLAANVRSLSYIWECPILSPTQLDIKNSLKQEDPDMSATLESQGIPQTADAQINFWQDQNAKEGSWINYRVVKSRFSVKGQGGKLSIDYRNMKMTDFNSEMENMINSVSSSNFNFDFDTIQG